MTEKDFSNFNSSFAQLIQDLCLKFFPFNDNVRVSGYLYWTIDDGQSVEHVVNEKLTKQDIQNDQLNSESLDEKPEIADEIDNGKKVNDQQIETKTTQKSIGIEKDEDKPRSDDDITTVSDADDGDFSLDPATTELLPMRVIPDLNDVDTDQLAQSPKAENLSDDKSKQNNIEGCTSLSSIGPVSVPLIKLESNLIDLAAPPEISQQSPKKRVHPKSSHGSLMCMQCGRSFKRRDYLRQHERTHSVERPEVCDICGKGFKCRSSLYQHRLFHKDKRYQCGHCNRRMQTKQSLMIHMRGHTGEKPFVCDTCGKGFTNICSLREHHVVHTGAKPYQCAKCPQVFSARGALRKHQNIHLGKKFACDICHKQFGSNAWMKEHRKTHTGEKPFHCDFPQCLARFSTKKYLTEHRRSHTGERPFLCMVCGKSFTQAGALLTHKKKSCFSPDVSINVSKPIEKKTDVPAHNMYCSREINVSVGTIIPFPKLSPL